MPPAARDTPQETPQETPQGTPIPLPRDLVSSHWRLFLCLAVLSVLVSLWAFHLDPVINNDGIVYIDAARHFTEGRWSEGFAIYKWPFYSILISVTAQTVGISEGHAAYLINTGLYVFILLGFVAFVAALGGTGRVLWLAAAVALLHPMLNEFRSFVIRDVGYWACYLWSLSGFLAYLSSRRKAFLAAGTVLAFMAFLFRVEGVLLITVLPACLYASLSTRNRGRAVVLLAGALATAVAVVLAPLWQYVSEIEVSARALAADPLRHVAGSWQMIGADITARFAALQREFPGISWFLPASVVYLATVLAMILVELTKSLGIVYTGLVAYALLRAPGYFREEARNWWWLMVAIQGLLVLQFGISNFFLADRYPVALSLTLLAVAPFLLDDLWRRSTLRGRRYARGVLIIAALVVIESIEGLDVATQKDHIREAGLWLRQNAPAESTLYSNSRILSYYAGLRTRSDTAYSWQEAMQEVWTGSWRGYDYFALVMTDANAGNEALLFRKIESQPVRTFSNKDGDKVLIFRSG